MNYASHAREIGLPIPDDPAMFLKPLSALAGPGEPVPCPARSVQVEHEAELACVMRRRVFRAGKAEALAAVWGYTCSNDVTARDIERIERQLFQRRVEQGVSRVLPDRAVDRGRDEIDPDDVEVRCLVNGAVRQRARTSHFIFDMATQIAWISQIMPLEPGDLVLTGTPKGSGGSFPATRPRSRSRASASSPIRSCRGPRRDGFHPSKGGSMATNGKKKSKDDGWVRTKVGRKVHIDTPPKTNANKNLGSRCAAVKANGFIFCSGAVAFDEKKGGIQHGTMESETRQTLKVLKSLLEANGSSLDRVIKVGVFIDTMIEFENMNRAYREFFPKPAGPHDRRLRTRLGRAGGDRLRRALRRLTCAQASATASISMSNGHGHAPTVTKVRAGGSWVKYSP